MNNYTHLIVCVNEFELGGPIDYQVCLKLAQLWIHFLRSQWFLSLRRVESSLESSTLYLPAKGQTGVVIVQISLI